MRKVFCWLVPIVILCFVLFVINKQTKCGGGESLNKDSKHVLLVVLKTPDENSIFLEDIDWLLCDETTELVPDAQYTKYGYLHLVFDVATPASPTCLKGKLARVNPFTDSEFVLFDLPKKSNCVVHLEPKQLQSKLYGTILFEGIRVNKGDMLMVSSKRETDLLKWSPVGYDGAFFQGVGFGERFFLLVEKDVVVEARRKLVRAEDYSDNGILELNWGDCQKWELKQGEEVATVLKKIVNY